MFRPPLVSVIIPAYNAAAFIRQALDSVLAQVYKNLEVVVVDDGSQDDTAQIVKSIAITDARVTLLRQSNQGVAAARNLAIEKSSGEFIAPLDADDIWHPKKLKRQIERMLNSGPTVGLNYTWYVRIDENSLLLSAGGKWQVEGKTLAALLYYNFIGNGSVPLIRRTCIEHVGGYKSEFRAQGGEGYEDWDLYLRIAEHYEFCVVPAYLVGYRRSPNSLSSNYAAMARSKKLLLQEVEQRHLAVPARILRWAKSSQCLLQIKVDYRKRNYLGAIVGAAQAFRWDPFTVLSLLYSTFNTLGKVIHSALIFFIWQRNRLLPHFHRGISSNARRIMPLIELEHGYKAKSQARSRLNLYFRIRVQRWRKTAEPSIPQSSNSGMSKDAARLVDV